MLRCQILMGLLCAVPVAAVEPVQRERWQNWTVEHGLPSNHILSIWRGGDGPLWVGTDAGLVRFNGVEFRPVGQSLAVTALAGTPDGRLWAGTRGQGLYLVSGDGLQRAPGLEAVREAEITCLRVAADGALWIGALNGLGRYAGGGLRFYRVADGLPAKKIRWIHSLQGDQVIATTDQGSVLAGAAGILGPASGETPPVRVSFEDSQGSLWTSGVGGLERLRRDRFETLGRAEGLPADFARALAPATGGGFWVATSEGLFHTKNGMVKGLPKRPVFSVAELEDGSLAAGSYGEGLWVRSASGWRRMRLHPDGGPEHVHVIKRARGGGLWVGTARGLFRIGADGRVSDFGKSQGLSSNGVDDVLESRDGTAWAATNAGLSEWTGGRWRPVPAAGRQAFHALAVAEGGGLWIAGRAGLFRWTGQQLLALNVDEPACAGRAFAVLEAGNELWWYGDRGVCRGTVHQNVLQSALVARVSGIYSEAASQPAVQREADGTLWFATAGGVLRLRPRKLDPPPVVAIEGVRVDGRPADFARGAELVPGEETLELEYAAQDLAHPEQVRYRYRLSGLDERWVEAGHTRTVTYSHLPRRDYVFEVSARGEDGNWGQAATLPLRVRPHFYQRWWFAALLAAGVLAGAMMFHRWRVATAERRLLAVMEERARIARDLHDTLAQSIGGISAQLEAARALLPGAPVQSRVHADVARRLASAALDEVRSFVKDLRHSPHAAGPIEDGLRAVGRAAGDLVQVEVRGKTRPISDGLRSCLFRVAQEAVRNAVKHAAARRVEVLLSYEAGAVRLRVSDDGIGFDMREVDSTVHFGLAGMRERAEQAGGELKIAAARGKGCAVELVVPDA